MGDGLNGLAAAITLASAAMVLAGAGVVAILGRLTADALGWRGGRRSLVVAACIAVGAAAGLCAVIATFYETTWRPPPSIRFVVPHDFKPTWVILLEDRTRGRPLLWRGREWPFMGVSTVIAVPPSGVVRVANLGPLLGNGQVRATWSTGSTMIGFTSGRAPPRSGATAFVAYQRERGLRYDPRDELPTPDDDVFAHYLEMLERRGGK